MNLYEINDRYKSALQDLESIDGLNRQVIDDSLAVFKDDLDQKCLSVAAFIKNLDAEAQAVKAAKDAMADRQKALENKAKSMREYLAANLPSKLKNDQLTVTPLKGREKIVVDNVSLLPKSCTKIEVKAVAAEVKENFDSLPDGAAHKEISPASVMIK